jgi:hypothetical protein
MKAGKTVVKEKATNKTPNSSLPAKLDLSPNFSRKYQ